MLCSCKVQSVFCVRYIANSVYYSSGLDALTQSNIRAYIHLCGTVPFRIHRCLHHPLVCVWIEHLHVTKMFIAIMTSNSVNLPCELINVYFQLKQEVDG